MWLLFLGFTAVCAPNLTPLQEAEQATKPYTNYIFAINASIPGRIYMTLNEEDYKPCINTITSFYNKYKTCSNCEDFVENPNKWNFTKVNVPEIGDIVIQHDSNGKAYHASIIVKIEGNDYYINHAVRTEYYKNIKLINKTKLTFYRYNKMQL